MSYYLFCVWCCEYEMVDERIISLWNIDESLRVFVWKPLIKQRNHHLELHIKKNDKTTSIVKFCNNIQIM